jgi:tripartite-type tricarboxylate transporter receptor subunit TctC
MGTRKASGLMAGFVAAAALVCAAGTVEGAEDFKGKQIRLIVGSGTGGGYDGHARLLSRHMAKYIPGNPTFVVQNMPGAGSLAAANYIYGVAPKDGTVFGTTHRFVPIMPLLEMDGAKFDASKFTYIGSSDKEVGTCVTWHTSGFKTFADVQQKELIVGTTGAGAQLTTFYAALANVAGAKLKVISGYKSSRDLNLAMEKGEIQGRCGASYGSLKAEATTLLEENKLNILLQLSLDKEPELPTVPVLLEVVQDKERYKDAFELLLTPTSVARPFFAPPDLPQATTDMLRAAFDSSMKDPKLLAEAEAQRFKIEPTKGKDIQLMVERLYQAKPAVVAQAKALVAD